MKKLFTCHFLVITYISVRQEHISFDVFFMHHHMALRLPIKPNDVRTYMIAFKCKYVVVVVIVFDSNSRVRYPLFSAVYQQISF